MEQVDIMFTDLLESPQSKEEARLMVRLFLYSNFSVCDKWGLDINEEIKSIRSALIEQSKKEG